MAGCLFRCLGLRRSSPSSLPSARAAAEEKKKKRKSQDEHTAMVDVLVDIDHTLVYSGGPIRLAPDPPVTYRLAHGALEFLLALDRARVRIGLYSCGHEARNRRLAALLAGEAIRCTGLSLRQRLEAFSVADGTYGKKTLAGLRKGLSLDRAILVDDSGRNVQDGEEANLLKIYPYIEFPSDYIKDRTASLALIDDVFQARVNNNLVRALGLIVQAMELSKADPADTLTVVQVLHQMQWDDDGNYLHQSSNSETIYLTGLKAMRAVNPHFDLALDASHGTYPWSSHPSDDYLFPQKMDEIINRCQIYA